MLCWCWCHNNFDVNLIFFCYADRNGLKFFHFFFTLFLHMEFFAFFSSFQDIIMCIIDFFKYFLTSFHEYLLFFCFCYYWVIVVWCHDVACGRPNWAAKEGKLWRWMLYDLKLTQFKLMEKQQYTLERSAMFRELIGWKNSPKTLSYPFM